MTAPATSRFRAALTAALLLLPASAAAQDYAPGEKLTLVNCGRCHVVSPKNRMGGIGSTPSFAVLKTIADWEERMKAFWTLRPHPSFTQIEGVTEPFPADRPAHVHPISLTLQELERIVAYARTVPPADLGSSPGMQ
jgi:mono/diheme cytochrome c family protein